MLTVHSDEHRLHRPVRELHRGAMVPCFERPERAEIILRALRERALGEIVPPEPIGLDPILRVHDPDYVGFLRTAHAEWRRVAGDTDALAHVWRIGDARPPVPASIYARLGCFSSDASTPITAGTWPAALASAACALTAARRIASGDPCAFALTRPPGHHASADRSAGYCFLNNAALAAGSLLDAGAARVAILDVDYHHGNGTQSIFYDRPDVLTLSIHADPRVAYPYFSGFEHETGEGRGEGRNANVPLPDATEWPAYARALDSCLRRIADFQPRFLVVSLGVDTYRGDPISAFSLDTPDFVEMGRLLASVALPTLFVMEGGYAADALGENVTAVLQGFEERLRA